MEIFLISDHTSLISTAESFKLPESISSNGDLLIEELNSKLSASVVNEMNSYEDFVPDVDFSPSLCVDLHQRRTGGVCDLTKWGSDEYHMKNKGLVELSDWQQGKHPTQVHCITERHQIGWSRHDDSHGRWSKCTFL